MSEPKIVKVIMEMDNGEIKFLEGEELEKWIKANDGAAGFLYAHGMKPWDDIHWKIDKKGNDK